MGYVPQDDIIHRELPLARTLRYAARLRLPARTSAEEVDRRVDEVLALLGLTDRAGLRVGSLSGGERKRASIGVEPGFTSAPADLPPPPAASSAVDAAREDIGPVQQCGLLTLRTLDILRHN